MCVFVGGYAAEEDANYCPKCGEKISEWNAGYIGVCEECGFRFAVVECEE